MYLINLTLTKQKVFDKIEVAQYSLAIMDVQERQSGVKGSNMLLLSHCDRDEYEGLDVRRSESSMDATFSEVDAAGDPRTEIARIIRAHWKQTFEGILEVGRCLIEGRYTRKEYDTYNLPFAYQHGRKLIKIASDVRIADPSNRPLLPDGMATLHHISLLSEKLFKRAVSEGVINPRCNEKDIKVFRRRHSFNSSEQPAFIKRSATYTDAKGKYQIHVGDALSVLRTLPSDSVDTCICSPPYYQKRSYGNYEGQLGHEETPQLYVEKLLEVYREVKRVVRPDGTLWVNIADSYAGEGKGHPGRSFLGDESKQATNQGSETMNLSAKTLPPGYKEKDLIEVSSMLAEALRADGWWFRSRIIWEKPNPMTESMQDRCTISHEYVFQFTKEQDYYYDYAATTEPAVSGGTRNMRSVWTISPKPYHEPGKPVEHHAQFPPELPEKCLLATSRPNGIVLDCFAGVGTTGTVAIKYGRSFIGIELNPVYAEIMERRFRSRIEQAA